MLTTLPLFLLIKRFVLNRLSSTAKFVKKTLISYKNTKATSIAIKSTFLVATSLTTDMFKTLYSERENAKSSALLK